MERDHATVGLGEFPVEALRFLLALGQLSQAAQELAVLVTQGDQGFLGPGAGDVLGQGREPLAGEGLAAVGKPFREGHDGALAGRRLNLEAIHQSAGPGDADAEPRRRTVATTEDLIQVRDARPLVDDADHQGLAVGALVEAVLDAAAAGVAVGVACDLGHGRGDAGLVLDMKAKALGQPARPLSHRDDVVLVLDQAGEERQLHAASPRTTRTVASSRTRAKSR